MPGQGSWTSRGGKPPGCAKNPSDCGRNVDREPVTLDGRGDLSPIRGSYTTSCISGIRAVWREVASANRPRPAVRQVLVGMVIQAVVKY
jgi:hypothetical protein